MIVLIHGDLCKKIEIWQYEQVVYAQPRICPGEWDTEISLGFRDTNWSPNVGQMTRHSHSQKNKNKKKTREKREPDE